jgi:hypothetical protein
MRILAAILFAVLALPANATFHLWFITEVYSNADGTVQFVEFKAAAAGQQFVKGHTLRSTATSGGASNSYTLPTDLPGDSAEGGNDPGGYYGGYGNDPIYKSFLIATQGFAALNIVTPDYIVPNGFLFPAGGTLNWGEGSDTFNHGALPADNRSISRDRTPQVPTPLNFAGNTGNVPAATTAASYQGLWLKSPLTSEPGWGINFTHQGSTMFATWYTYDTDGSGMWLVMSNGTQVSAGKFEGELYRTTGPGFNAEPFTAIGASNYTKVGNLSVTFSDGNNGSLSYTVNGVSQTKPITRFLFGASTCTLGGTMGTPPNYSDLWYRSEAEAGWGVNIVHQGDILFVTWFPYESGGTAAAPAKGMWLVMSNANKTAEGVYTGVLQRTTGPNAFSNTTPFDPNLVKGTTVGDATLTFTGPNTANFRYTVNGVTQTKPITRLIVGAPATICR